MIQTVEAVIDENGRVQLLEDVRLARLTSAATDSEGLEFCASRGSNIRRSIADVENR